MKKLTAILLGLCLVVMTPARAAIDLTDFGGNTELEERYHTLVNELRCLVCQNQTIADSNADLAKDLRREVHDMLVAGKTDDEIKEFMLERYGDFVLYNPPIKPSNYLIWFGPFVLLLVAGILLLRAVRRQKSTPAPEITPEERARLDAILGNTPPEKDKQQ